MKIVKAYYVPLDGGAGAATWSPEEVSASTVAATAVATGHHMFKLEGYSLLKLMHASKNGAASYIESPAFEVGGHTWRIRCYLNGKGEENSGFVSLFLYLCRSSDAVGPVVHADFQFALVPHRQQGTPPPEHGHQGSKPSKTTTSHGAVRSVVLSAFGGGKDNSSSSGWGLSRFISVEELERSSFLQDDCFAVRCTVTVVQERTVKEKTVQAHDMARLGMLCKCDDDMCKRVHATPRLPNETFLERFANFCYSICRGSR